MTNQDDDPWLNIQIAKPCPAYWGKMSGDNKVRLCGECNLHVYNISAITKNEAERLIKEKEGKMCVRFYRRTDGRVLTSDCPKGTEYNAVSVKGVLRK